MAFQKVTSLDCDITYALGKKDKAGKPYPTSVEGYYLGNRQVQTKLGPTKLHIFQTPKGNVGVWGGTDMNRKLTQTKLGTMTRVTAAGKKPMPKGDMNVFTVEVDIDNTIPVADSDGASSDANESFQSADESSDELGAGYENEESDSEADEPAYEARTSGLTAAQRAAKVQSLLSKNKGRN